MSRRSEVENRTHGRRRRVEGIQRPLRLDVRGRQLLTSGFRSDARRFCADSAMATPEVAVGGNVVDQPLTRYERSMTYLLRLGVIAFIGGLILLHSAEFQAAATTLLGRLF